MEGASFTSRSISDLTDSHIMMTYGRQPVVFDRGDGSVLWDVDGKRYIDFLSGLAVENLGHVYRPALKAAQDQLQKLWHVSNIFYTAPAAMLAERLTTLTFADRVFFCNSGAEANEAAIKLARKYASVHRDESCREILVMERSFHGRTLATLTATGQQKVKVGFDPLVPGFRFVPFGDLGALESAMDAKTCAVMLEPIQAEGGVHVAPPGYLAGVRSLCDARGALLIFDEIQVGMSRTGKFSAHEWDGVTPDIMSMAKALGGGLPLGACLAKQTIADAFQVGSHATTFGGNPVACAAGLAMVKGVSDPTLLAHCQAMGQVIQETLQGFQKKFDFIREVRGRGMIWGFEIDFDAKGMVSQCLERGLVVTLAGPQVVRLLPALNIPRELLEEGLAILGAVLESTRKAA